MSEFYLVYIEFFLIQDYDSDVGLQYVSCFILGYGSDDLSNTQSFVDDFVDDEDTPPHHT